MAALGGCTEQGEKQSSEVDTLVQAPSLPPQNEVPNGPKVVLPLTEQSPLELVKKRYSDLGLKIDSVVSVPNPLKGIVLKAQWGEMRVREGDSVQSGATLRLWVGG